MNKPIVKLRTRKFNEQDIKNPPSTLKKETPYKGILGSGKTGDEIKLAMWNVNGIRSVLNKNALYNFIKSHRPDILCINQTKINKEQFDKSPIEVKGYSGYWNFCKVSAGYSGVAIFSKFLPLSLFEDLQEPVHSQEGRVITLEYEHFYLVNVYIPSAGDKKLERLEYKTEVYERAFHKYCNKLKEKGKGVIVCGDFNVCHKELDIHMSDYVHKTPGFTDKERKSFDSFLKKGWVDTFRKLNPADRVYTWWRIEHGNRERNIGKRLDYFLVNEAFLEVVVSAKVLGDVMGSDHCPVFLAIDLRKLKANKKEEIEGELMTNTQLVCSQVQGIASQQKVEEVKKVGQECVKQQDLKKEVGVGEQGQKQQQQQKQKQKLEVREYEKGQLMQDNDIN